MTEPGSSHTKMGRDAAAGLRVGDVMVRRPKTLPVDASVGDLREHFTNPRVQTALLSDEGRFAGAIAPAELPETADAAEPARDYARLDVPTTGPGTPMEEALALLDERGDYRLIVLDGAAGQARLVGLLCLDRSGASFCTYTPATTGGQAQAP